MYKRFKNIRDIPTITDEQKDKLRNWAHVIFLEAGADDESQYNTACMVLALLEENEELGNHYSD